MPAPPLTHPKKPQQQLASRTSDVGSGTSVISSVNENSPCMACVEPATPSRSNTWCWTRKKYSPRGSTAAARSSPPSFGCGAAGSASSSSRMAYPGRRLSFHPRSAHASMTRTCARCSARSAKKRHCGTAHRPTCGTPLQRCPCSKAPLAYVSKQLGHADKAITLRLLTHWLPESGVEQQEAAWLDALSERVARELQTRRTEQAAGGRFS